MSSTTTKERPILFSGPMVRAIQAGRKTQTRRVAEPLNNPMPHHQPCEYRYANGRVEVSVRGGPWREIRVGKGKNGEGNPCRCPYGQPGDALWVRETWANLIPATSMGQGPVARKWLRYRADAECGSVVRWVPSIHMPRWACRIVLELTDVRVERVQEISREDSIAEGCPMPTQAEGMHPWPEDQFRHLWDSINAGRGYGWVANPWVWVLSFRRIEPENHP